jgi:hypothetical protein
LLRALQIAGAPLQFAIFRAGSPADFPANRWHISSSRRLLTIGNHDQLLAVVNNETKE